MAAERIRKLLELTRGRAFVLFTSYAQMNEIYQRLLGYCALLLNKATRQRARCSTSSARLNAAFCHSSLAGVDVQGEQLSCVIIDRLPFAVPSDPVVAARVKAIDARAARIFSVSGARRGDHAVQGFDA